MNEQSEVSFENSVNVLIKYQEVSEMSGRRIVKPMDYNPQKSKMPITPYGSLLRKKEVTESGGVLSGVT